MTSMPASWTAEIFTPDVKTDPYWCEATPRPDLPETPLPRSVDVVGSGHTGLDAALVTARGAARRRCWS